MKQHLSLMALLQAWHKNILEACARDIAAIENMLDLYSKTSDAPSSFEWVEAHRAWETVLDKIKSVGSYETVVFENHMIHAVIRDMGGWARLCSLIEATHPYWQSEFIKRYIDYKRCPALCYPPFLKGRFRSDIFK